MVGENKAKSGLEKLNKQTKKDTLGFKSKGKINQFYILNQSTALNFLPSSGVQGASPALLLHCISGEKGTLERAVTGKQKHGARVAVGLRFRLNKARTLSRLSEIPGSPAQHTVALRLPGHTAVRQGLSVVRRLYKQNPTLQGTHFRTIQPGWCITASAATFQLT